MNNGAMIIFENDNDLRRFMKWAKMAQEKDGTPPSLYTGLAANAIKRAKLALVPARDLLNALEVAQATIERLQRHAPGSANGTLDVIKAAIDKATNP